MQKGELLRRDRALGFGDVQLWDECILDQEVGDADTCPACRRPFVQPTLHMDGNCFFQMCKACFANLRSAGSRGTCPSCFKDCKTLSLNRSQSNRVDSYVVSCRTCGTRVTRGNFSRHFFSECKIQCPHCHESKGITRDSLTHHLKACPETEVSCSRGCREIFLRKAASAHETICRAAIVACSPGEVPQPRACLRALVSAYPPPRLPSPAQSDWPAPQHLPLLQTLDALQTLEVDRPAGSASSVSCVHPNG